MKGISFCSLAFRNDPIEAVLPRIAEVGFDGIEIFGKHLEGASAQTVSDLRKQADDLSLPVAALSPYFSFTQSEPQRDESLERGKRFVGYANALGCSVMRTFTDVGPTGVGSDVATPQQWSQCVDALQKLTAMDRSITFAVETHKLTLADTVDTTLRLLKEVGAPNLKVLYQPSIPEFMHNVPGTWARLKAETRHMHLQNATLEGETTWLDDGVLDLAGFVRQAIKDGYDGWLSVEYCFGTPTWDQVETAHKLMREWTRSID